MQEAIKLYLISGFLGSGKTTFLQHLLTDFADKKVGVIVNEFGNIGIDGKLVNRNSIKLVEINNGSIFCSCLKGGFVKTLLSFTKENIDILFIENSGMADPSNMHRLLQELDGKIEREYAYQGAVCILDPVSFLKYVQVLNPVINQVVSASFIVINKVDLVNQGTIEKIREKINELNKQAYIYQTMYGEVPPVILQDHLMDNGYEGQTSNRPYNRIYTCSLECSNSIEKRNLKKFIRQMQDKLYRMKGFVMTKEGWIQVDVVGDICLLKQAERHKRDVIQHTKLVLIGKGPEEFAEEMLILWEQICKEKGELYE